LLSKSRSKCVLLIMLPWVVRLGLIDHFTFIVCSRESGDLVDIKPLFGLGGVLIAAMTSQFNDQVTAIALIDVRGALGISHDAGTWIESLYVWAEIVGMAISPWLAMTFTLRRWTLFSIALCGASGALIPFSPNVEAIYALRLFQGLAGGLIIPLLMTTAFRVLTPSIRLYGLAVYALTATFTPALAATVAALWTDIVDWRIVFLEAVPLCSLAGVLVWYGLHQDQPKYERFRMLDWRGVLLLVIGSGALSTMLYQGGRLDWFNSKLICVLALVSVLAMPLLLANEWFHPLPLLKLQMLGRRNIAYGALGLFLFLIISQSGSTVPLQYLREVQGYRPLPDHTRDRGVTTCHAARHGAVAGSQVGRFTRGQHGRVGIDSRVLHWLVLSHNLLESRSILFMAVAPGDRSADGDHAAADDDHQCRRRPGRRTLRVRPD
jgi:MFS family permease